MVLEPSRSRTFPIQASSHPDQFQLTAISSWIANVPNISFNLRRLSSFQLVRVPDQQVQLTSLLIGGLFNTSEKPIAKMYEPIAFPISNVQLASLLIGGPFNTSEVKVTRNPNDQSLNPKSNFDCLI
ncbi:hypothetical protein DY000_02061892 [Brassica cretica]|uniref:Uncharacterized protein n=1 Tax=Brassica cretica TaxID=69181 RepID=A0ABQ7AX42_BRACR|nr:hypothetical protein DY000_02061892 [Brassica cretica]